MFVRRIVASCLMRIVLGRVCDMLSRLPLDAFYDTHVTMTEV